VILGDPNGGCWPTELQELLLKAALFDGDAACQAYRDWHAQGGLERLDAGSYRLLPLVGHNLGRYGFEHKEMGTLRGLRRKTWCENRLLFARLAPAAAMLQQAGIPVLVLKGVPLALRYYRDAGLRPMRDLDLLVPEQRAREAIQLFQSAGWRELWPGRYRLGPRDLGFRQALPYAAGDGREMDLHWHALYQATFPGADAAFFSRRFLVERPLLQALTSEQPVVMLIDEIDRADPEFEAFLLEILAERQVTIPELGTVRAKHAPLFVLTSNGTRDMTDALRRRCLHAFVDYPPPSREQAILELRVPGVGAALAAQLAAFAQKVRTMDLRKSPSIAETIDWARALLVLGASALDPELARSTLGLLVKYEEDRVKVEGKLGSLVGTK